MREELLAFEIQASRSLRAVYPGIYKKVRWMLRPDGPQRYIRVIY
jgi:hypothetical protein